MKSRPSRSDDPDLLESHTLQELFTTLISTFCLSCSRVSVPPTDIWFPYFGPVFLSHFCVPVTATRGLDSRTGPGSRRESRFPPGKESPSPPLLLYSLGPPLFSFPSRTVYQSQKSRHVPTPLGSFSTLCLWDLDMGPFTLSSAILC